MIHVALLRGINVGGKNMLPMIDLRRLFKQAGCGDVSSYIQSGNVIFSANRALARRLPGLITDAVADEFGFRIPVVLREAAELAKVVAANPFVKRRAEVKALAVAFLEDKPTPARVESLDEERSPGDEFVVNGREIFLYLPNGAAKTKLTNAWFDAQLQTTSTVRNWKTVLELTRLALGED